MSEGTPPGTSAEFENSSAWMAEYRDPNPDLSNVLQRLEAASEGREPTEASLQELREEIDHAAQKLYTRFDELTGNGISPRKAIKESGFHQAEDAFQVAQMRYTERWLQTNLNPVIIPGTKEMVQLVQDIDPTNVRGYIEFLPVLLSDSIVHKGVFRFDTLIRSPLNLLSPIAYKNIVEQQGKDRAGRLYDELRSLAEVTGAGTVYDHIRLIGMTKADLVDQGVCLEASVDSHDDEEVVASVSTIGFSPNRLTLSPAGFPIKLTEPLIEPTFRLK